MQTGGTNRAETADGDDAKPAPAATEASVSASPSAAASPAIKTEELPAAFSSLDPVNSRFGDEGAYKYGEVEVPTPWSPDSPAGHSFVKLLKFLSHIPANDPDASLCARLSAQAFKLPQVVRMPSDELIAVLATKFKGKDEAYCMAVELQRVHGTCLYLRDHPSYFVCAVLRRQNAHQR